MALFAIAVQTHDLLGLPGFLRPIVRYGDVLAGIIVAQVAITHHFVIDPFDQVETLEVLLPAFIGIVRTMHFDGDRLEEEAPTGFALATDIAEWLVKNGVPFRHAHELSGACVKIAEDRGQELWDLTDEDFINVFKDFLPADKAPQVREVLSTEGSVSARNGKGGTSPLRVREQIVSAKTTIEQLRAFANSVSDGSAYKSPESLLK